MRPATVGQRPRQVIQHELHRYGRGQRSVPEDLAVAQLQPRRPVGEGAAVTAHGVGRGAGGDKGRGGCLGVKRQKMRIQWGFVDQRQLVCNI
ncbi:hypothetical protein D3C85_1373030 [compost metagenome]